MDKKQIKEWLNNNFDLVREWVIENSVVVADTITDEANDTIENNDLDTLKDILKDIQTHYLRK